VITLAPSSIMTSGEAETISCAVDILGTLNRARTETTLIQFEEFVWANLETVFIRDMSSLQSALAVASGRS
jgi:hypothetical protein